MWYFSVHILLNVEDYNIYTSTFYINLSNIIFMFYLQLCNLLGFICIQSSNLSHTSRGNWFGTVSMGGFWFTGIMLVFYIFHVTDKLSIVPWLKIEFCFCILWTFFYLLAASLAAGYGMDEGFAAAAVSDFSFMLIVFSYNLIWGFNSVNGSDYNIPKF